jgi:hypothetical protein
MKNPYEILSRKEEELAQVRRDINSLKIAAGLLEDDARLAEDTNGCKEKQLVPEEEALNVRVGDVRLDDVRLDDVRLDLDTLGDDGGLFSAIGRSRSRFWKALTRAS